MAAKMLIVGTISMTMHVLASPAAYKEVAMRRNIDRACLAS